jgi:hypothetical protein
VTLHSQITVSITMNPSENDAIEHGTAPTLDDEVRDDLTADSSQQHRGHFSTTRLAKTNAFDEEDLTTPLATEAETRTPINRQARSAHSKGTTPTSGPNKKLMRGAILAMVAILGYVAYDSYRSSHGALPQIVAAEPGQTGPMDLGGGLDADPTPKASEQSKSVAQPAALTPLSQATVDLAPKPMVAASAVLPTPSPEAPQQALAVAPAAATNSVNVEEFKKVNDRLDQLSQDMATLMARLGDRGPSAADRTAVPQRSKSIKPIKSARTTPAAPAPVEIVVAPRVDAQLLSVDMWNGRPSVVLGTTQAGDRRMRMLQPGESQAGIGLQSADVVGQKATFVIDGKAVTLSKTP